MRIWLLSAAGAVLALGLCPQLPPLSCVPALVAVALASLRWTGGVARAVCGCSIGLAWAIFSGHAMLSQRVPVELEGRDLLISGYLSAMPSDTALDNGSSLRRFELKVSAARPLAGGERLSLGRLRLNWYGGPELHPGERWRLVVRLKRPHGTASPGVMDRAAQQLSQGVGAVGYVLDHPCNKRLAGIEIKALHHRLRRLVGQHLAARGGDYSGLLTALVNGDRQRPPTAVRALMERTGTVHLLAISGLHIALVAGLCFYLAQAIARLLVAPLRCCPAPIWGALAALVGACSYAALAGFSLPTQRALVMVASLMAARLLRRRTSRGVGLCAALAVVLAWDPLAGFSVGFWLSFVAVAALLMAVEEGGSARLWRFARAQFAVSLALILPLGRLLGSVPLISPLANAFTIPLVSWLVVPAALLGSVMLPWWPAAAEWPLRLAELSAALSLWLLALLPTPTWQPPPWPLPVLVLAAVGVVAVLHWHRWLLGALLLAPLLWVPVPSTELLRLSVLDVGQGLAVLVETARHSLLYDSGPIYRGGYSAARGIILPFLRHRGHRRLDAMVISHADSDHAGGASILSEALPIDQLWRGEPLPGLRHAQPCRAGQRWSWDGIDFEFLHPLVAGGGNDQSCVLLIRVAERLILLPGDIGAAVERRLATRLPGTVDVLVAPHHGSASSSSEALLATVRPRHVVFSRAARNPFGHPDSAVLQRYMAVDSRLWDTALDGTVQFDWRSAETPPAVRAFRRQHRRYWHSAAE